MKKYLVSLLLTLIAVLMESIRSACTGRAVYRTVRTVR